MRSVAAATATVALVAACSQTDSAACEAAAWSQADAEQHWAATYEAHTEAHEHQIEHGDDPATDVLGARVTMILAEAETRRLCS